MFVCCKCSVLSGRGLCDKLIIRPEDSYRLLRVVVCDLETSSMRGLWLTGCCSAKKKKTINNILISRILLCFHNWKSHPSVKKLPL